MFEELYENRFKDMRIEKNKIWKTLCRSFFQKFIDRNDIVLDIGSGFCEFINNIDCKEKIAIDINKNIKKYAEGNVKTFFMHSTNMKKIKSKTIDVVFASNIFEHMNKKEIIKSIDEIKRVLKNNGKLLILQPNIRFCYKEYWNFFDHITPLDDRSMKDILETKKFTIKKCIPKFLPYSTKSKYSLSPTLLKIYLKFTTLQKLLGKQMFICAEKTG